MLRALAVVIALLALTPAYAADNAYQALLTAAKRGDPVDWQALRFAYAESPDFDLLGSGAEDARKQMYADYRGGDFAGALQQAASVLGHDYVDIDAHMVADLAARKLGDEAQAKLHHDAAIGLLNSIRTGDGHTPETAYTVITVGEEYAVLRAYGLRPSQQALISNGGHSYDRLDAIDHDGKTVTLYFLIDRVLAAEDAALNGKPKP